MTHARVLSILVSIGAGLFATAADAATCASLTGLALPHTTITSAAIVPATATVPEYCLATAVSRPTSDSNITILVALPTSGWNGKFLQAGNGGFAGTATVPADAVARGYAAAATDDGHTGNAFDATWALGHPEKVIDFGYRALKETTDTAKAVIAAFYGQPPMLSYFQGCSDGGREALMEAQRYPDDWDGIIAGAPANFWTHLLTGALWNEQALTLDPASTIPAAKLPAIQAAALAQCDLSDGIADGVVEDPRVCRFDPAALLCTGADADTCLTAPQVTAIQRIMSGAVNPRTGQAIFPGWLFNAAADPNFLGIGAWLFTGGGLLPVPVQFVFVQQFFAYMVFEDPSWDYRTFDFDADLAFTDAKLAGTLNSTDPDLGPIERRGAKIIMYHGWEDGAISPWNSINYYTSVLGTQRPGVGKGVGEDRVALRRTQDFFRLFMVPGMLHCGFGPGPNVFDSLGALERWVEDGVAPDRIIATKYVNDDPSAGVQRTRPLCPYPAVDRYTGPGSTDDAANFVCVR